MLSKERITQFLKNPIADKILGLVAVAPAFYSLYQFFVLVQTGQADLYRTAVTAGTIVLITSVIIRRTAKRVSVNPFYWLVTGARNYWVIVVLYYIQVPPPYPLAPLFVTYSLLFLSIAVILYSRISLGRNLGFVPARRELVVTGAYGYARHPIHTGELLFFLAFLLTGFSVVNWSLIVLGCVFVVWKSLIEERFLKDDEDYREYCRRVPWRWVPGII